MMKLMRFLIILSLIISVSATFPGAARADDPTPGAPVGGGISVYLPTIFTTRFFTVSGQVTGPESEPLSGVTITSGSGETALTDQNGAYAIKLQIGETDLAAEKDGFLFSPTAVELNVTNNLVGQDFAATATVIEGFTNVGFEDSSYWLLNGGAAYSSDISHSGNLSIRSGIVDPAANAYLWSHVSSPLINIPASATSVTLRTWLYTLSTDSAVQVSYASPTSLFGDTISALDAQYVMVLDGSNNLLETLMSIQANERIWTNHVFDLSKYAGKSIKIQIGSYNDGADGITAMYVDDISLEIGEGFTSLTPQAICYNGLYNSGFEYVGDWKIPATAYSANYSSTYSYAGVTSMRTGIPLDKLVNVYSYSDAWQTVTIPADATSASLNIKLLPMSEEPEVATSLAAIERDVDPGAPMAGSTWGDSELALDAAYILVLNPYTQTIIKTIWYKENRNSTYWLDKSWDLMEFAGKTIRIQFGVYNDGYGGQSVMYVDEAFVDICTGMLPPPPPPPPPPPLCEERIDNNSFEVTSDWYIPPTAFSAGYSTYRAHWGVRSMRTGIKYLSQNKYSYSDFGQVVTVPWWADTATLSMYLFNSSSEPYSVALADQPNMAEFGDVLLYGDIQYLLVLDLYGNWIDTLLWQRTNEQFWKYVSVDLSKYAGHTIKLQWGTYNDGWGGVTSMFVDDVSLIACP